MNTDNTRARALALLREAHAIVEQLCEDERAALHHLNNAIGTLLPDAPDGEAQRPTLQQMWP